MSDEKKFPPGGRLFSNRKTSPNQPDVDGDLEIDQEVLSHLIECSKSGKPIKMRLAGWRKKLQNSGGTFYSLKASVPRDREAVAKPSPLKPRLVASLDELEDESPF